MVFPCRSSEGELSALAEALAEFPVVDIGLARFELAHHIEYLSPNEGTLI
jgi:hypothetical protein